MLDIISLLVANIIPLYVLIALGFIAGRWMDVNLTSIAKLLIFFLSPVVTFGAILNIDFNPSYILLPILLFIISTFVSLSSFRISKIFFKDGNANLIGASGVNGNSLYFGIPVVGALFGPEGVGIWVLMNLGPSINNFTLAYYLTARGKSSVKNSIIKLTKVPTIYAAIISIILNIYNFNMPNVGITYWNYSTGAFVILGMMMIGIALSKQSGFQLDFKLLSSFFITKFFIWPLLIIGLIALDQLYFQLYHEKIYTLMILFSVMPLIGNLVAYAAENNLHPERAAAAVLISTVFAIFTVPAAVILYQFIS